MKTKDAITAAGGIQQLCKLLNCTRAAVYQWGEFVPTPRQFELEVKTNSLLKSDYTLHREQDAPERGSK